MKKLVYNTTSTCIANCLKILPGESKSASLSMKIDRDVCADKKKIADGFNKFFTGAVQCLLQEFGQIKDSAVNQSEPRVSGNKSYPEFKFQFITQNFTLSELKNLKCNKSSGMDNIPPRTPLLLLLSR